MNGPARRLLQPRSRLLTKIVRFGSTVTIADSIMTHSKSASGLFCRTDRSASLPFLGAFRPLTKCRRQWRVASQVCCQYGRVIGTQ